jgi:hypothetical protein
MTLCWFYVTFCNSIIFFVVIIYLITIFTYVSDHKVIALPHWIASIFLQVMKFLLTAKEDTVNIDGDKSLTKESKDHSFVFVG